MKLSHLRARIRPERIATVDESTTNAYGGVLPRITPTSTGNLFTRIPGRAFDSDNYPDDDLGPIIAARPPSAPMLASSDFHTQVITANGFVRRTQSVDFARPGNQGNVHDAAVDSVTHALDPNVFPTVRREILRGQSPG